MKTFSMLFSEDAGEKFKSMSDDQFADWKKNNPGASAKADKLRSGDSDKGTKKPEIETDETKLPTSAMAKTGKSKPDIRKSQIGKWSQGIKSNPTSEKKKSSAITKAPEEKKKPSAIVKRDDIKHVDVKDLGAKTPDEKQAGKEPGTSRKPDPTADKQRKEILKDKEVEVPKAAKKAVAGVKKGVGVIANIAKKLAQKSKGDRRGTATSGDLGGLSGRNKGLIN